MTSQIAARAAARLLAAGAAAVLALTLGAVPAATAAPGAGPALAPAPARAPSAAGWISEMNQILDKSGSFFIADYGDPGYFDWSSDGCSNSPDSYPYGFLWACRRHDFGYRNLKRGESRYGRDMWNINNKAVVDRQFHEDLYTHCSVEHGNSSGCRAAADAFHAAVSRVGGNTVGINRATLVL